MEDEHTFYIYIYIYDVFVLETCCRRRFLPGEMFVIIHFLRCLCFSILDNVENRKSQKLITHTVSGEDPSEYLRAVPGIKSDLISSRFDGF